MFATMLAVGLLQNIHLRSTASKPTRYLAAPRVLDEALSCRNHPP